MSEASPSKRQSLPVAGASAATTERDWLRIFLQTSQRRAAQLAEGVTLDMGVAYASAEFAGLADANAIFDARVPDEMAAASAIDAVDAHFTAQGSSCHCWIFSPYAAPEAAADLRGRLIARGFAERREAIFRLSEIGDEHPMPDGVRVIPARASFRHAQSLAESMGLSATAVEADLRRLDDPHWDRLLALCGGEAVGGVGVLAAGDIGRIDDLHVRADHRQRGIGSMLLDRAIEICRRSLFRHVLTAAGKEDLPGQELRKRARFVEVSRLERYTLLK